MRFVWMSLLFFSSVSYGIDYPVVARKYFNEFLGHVHKNPAPESSSLTIVQCQHSVKILKRDNVPLNWFYVQVGEDRGYVHGSFLSSKRPDCFQDKYPKFYQTLNLDLSEMYFWGKLSDHYLQGKTRAR